MLAIELSPQEAFDRLIAILNTHKLQWVVEQVQTQIRIGKSGTRLVKELTSSMGSADPLFKRGEHTFFVREELRPGRRAKFRTTEPYTDSERVALVISSIRQALINTTEMTESVTRRFQGATFVSEDDAQTRFAVSEFESEQRVAEVEGLRRALDTVMAQIG